MIKNLLLAFGSLLVALLLGELLTRILVEQETKRLAVYDADLGWRGRPGGEGVYIRKEDGIRAAFRYNELGFRDEPPDPGRAAGGRILLIGDSFVESLEVEYDDTFHRITERRLESTLPAGADVAIISSQGYSTAQELLAYQKYRDVLAPDVVLLCFFTGNDYSDNMRRTFAYLNEQDDVVFPENRDSWMRIQFYGLQRWLYESSHLVFFVKNWLESRTSIRVEAQGKAEAKASDERKYEVSRRLVSEMRDIVVRDGRSFGVVIIPGYKDIVKERYHLVSVMNEHCRADSIPAIDLYHDLSPQDYFTFDGHLRVSGHAKVADRIIMFLENEFLRPRTEPENE